MIALYCEHLNFVILCAHYSLISAEFTLLEVFSKYTLMQNTLIKFKILIYFSFYVL